MSRCVCSEVKQWGTENTKLLCCVVKITAALLILERERDAIKIVTILHLHLAHYQDIEKRSNVKC